MNRKTSRAISDDEMHLAALKGKRGNFKLDQAIQAMLEYKQNGETVSYRFNGFKLESSKITENNIDEIIENYRQARNLPRGLYFEEMYEATKGNLMFDQVVQAMLKYKQKGESVYYIFNGFELNSDEITSIKDVKEMYDLFRKEQRQEIEERESKETRKETKKDISEYLASLQEIEKDKLNERDFYEKVLSVISGMEDVSLTPETARELKDTLTEIGCMSYDQWKEQKEENGELIEENNIGKGIEQADLSTAVTFVSQLLGDYKNASFSLPYMLDGEKYSWVNRWIKNSKEKVKEQEKSEIESTLSMKEAVSSAIKSGIGTEVINESEEIERLENNIEKGENTKDGE